MVSEVDEAPEGTTEVVAEGLGIEGVGRLLCYPPCQPYPDLFLYAVIFRLRVDKLYRLYASISAYWLLQ